MKDNIAKFNFTKIFNVEKLITMFYMEFSKDFKYDGESHDFWELVYIDKGEMLCTADTNNFVLKSGELTLHKPNEYHNLTGNGTVAPNVIIITFECRSREMKFFEGKIFQLDSEEKTFLSMLLSEGLSHFKIRDEHNPLSPIMEELENSPLGSSQMTKNLLEIFLIKLRRNTEMMSKKSRQNFSIENPGISYDIKEILDCISDNIYGKLTVTDIAVSLGKSESTIKNIFSSYKPNGIIRYYNQKKIEEAKKLIREDKYNFTQIADMLHFDTPQYFSKCFKAFTNMTPSEYKSSVIK